MAVVALTANNRQGIINNDGLTKFVFEGSLGWSAVDARETSALAEAEFLVEVEEEDDETGEKEGDHSKKNVRFRRN